MRISRLRSRLDQQNKGFDRMNDIHLRPASIDDAEAMATLLGELGYPSTAEQVRARMMRIAQDAAYRIDVAVQENDVVGLMVLQRGWSLEHDTPFARLLALVVSERVRGAGVGAVLVRAAEAWAREQGAHALHLTTSLHREGAHRFYERLGFDRTGWRYVRPL